MFCVAELPGHLCSEARRWCFGRSTESQFASAVWSRGGSEGRAFRTRTAPPPLGGGLRLVQYYRLHIGSEDETLGFGQAAVIG